MDKECSSPALLLLFFILIDQLSKHAARLYLQAWGETEIAAGLLRFTLVENDGGFLGVVAWLPAKARFLLLTLGVGALLALCLWWLFLRPGRNRPYLSLLLLTAGGLGNLIDRLLPSGAVTDFVSIGLGSFRSGIFNLADLFILTGGFLLGERLFGRKSSIDR